MWEGGRQELSSVLAAAPACSESNHLGEGGGWEAGGLDCQEVRGTDQGLC